MSAHEKNALPDPKEIAKTYAEVAQRASNLITEHMKRQMKKGISAPSDDLGIAQAFMDMMAKMLANPYKLAQAQMNLVWDYFSLWQHSTLRMMGMEGAPVAQPKKGDKRFADAQWEEHFLFDFIKQSYLITARHIHDSVGGVEDLDDISRKKVNFFTRQFIDALAPSNFALTNPEVLRETVKSNGQNLLKGFNNLLRDIEEGDGQLRVKMTDPSAFEMGKNVASTPGKVIFQNEMIQLIQFNPTTKEQYKRPLLIIPPWINKYYILDLRDSNSYIKWATDQGHTVFVISWVNPDAKLAKKGFDDYMTEGAITAIDVVCQQTGEKEVNMIGYCLGGTLLGSTMGYMAAKKDKRIASATFFVALLDFSIPGELGVFIDEGQVASLEKKMEERGYLEGSEMARHLQHAALQRPDLDLRGQQLPDGQGPLPLRPALLELRFHAHALQDAQLLPAQHVPQQPAARARRHHPARHADRPVQGQDAVLLHLHHRRPHRAVAQRLSRLHRAGRPGALRPGRLGPHRRHRQSAVGQQVRFLDQRRPPGNPGRMVRRRQAARRLVVDRLAEVDHRPERRQGAGPRPGQGQAQAAGRCAGFLRQVPPGYAKEEEVTGVPPGREAGAESQGSVFSCARLTF
jgi:hypothetical protein